MNLEYRSGRHIDFDVGDAKRAPIFWPPLDESGRGDQQQQRDEENARVEYFTNDFARFQEEEH